MADATPGPVYGDDAKLYYSATLGGAGALTEVTCVVDDTVTRERRSSEVVYRGATEVSEHVGKSKNSISGTFMLVIGSAVYLAMRAAFEAKTTLHWAAASSDILLVNAVVTELEGKIKSWVESRPDNGNVTVAVEIVRTPDSAYASTVSTVSS